MIHSGSFIGTEVPVWDIADNFGETNLLVTNMAQIENFVASATIEARKPARAASISARVHKA